MAAKIGKMRGHVLNKHLNSISVLTFPVTGMAVGDAFTLDLSGPNASFFAPKPEAKAVDRPSDHTVWIVAWLIGKVASVKPEPLHKRIIAAITYRPRWDLGLTVTITSGGPPDPQPVPATFINDPSA